MKKQRTTEWVENIDIDYHIRQFETPYQSTIKFCNFLEKNGKLGGRKSSELILDAGSGSGGNIKYMGEQFANQYIGVDLNNELVELGNDYFLTHGLEHKLMQGDLFNLSALVKQPVEGIISFQTLSWLPDYKAAINSMASLQPNWIAASSPFEINIELAPPSDKGLGSYTRDFASGEKAQFTGPLMLPWYFIVASK
jgi:hypothetical protein